MAKEKLKCFDCNADHSSGRGDGKCSHCYGTGKDYSTYGILDVVVYAGSLKTITLDEPCGYCSGTKQCQMCGGSGYVHVTKNKEEEQGYEEDNEDYRKVSEQASMRFSDWVISILIVGFAIIGMSVVFTGGDMWLVFAILNIFK